MRKRSHHKQGLQRTQVEQNITESKEVKRPQEQNFLLENINVEDYDKHKFKEFLTSHNLHKLREVSAVIVVGLMGAGKSTTIAIQLGAIYKRSPKGKGFDKVSSGTFTPATSHGFTSKTLNINSYEDLTNRLMYLDTAGLDENRGKEEKLWTRASLDILFSIVKEIKAVVVVIDYCVTFGAKAEGFRSLADSLYKVTMGADYFYDSMIFVITNGYNGPNKVTQDFLLDRATQMLNEIKGSADDFENRLRTRFSDINSVPEDDKEHLIKIRSTQKLLKTLIDSQGRIIFSDPDGSVACKELQNKLLHQIQAVPVINKEILAQISHTHLPNNRLLIQNLLSSIASDYLHIGLAREAELLLTLVETYHRKASQLEAIGRNWASVKRDLISTYERKIKSIRVKIGLKEEELSRQESSTAIVVHQEMPILKACNVGFLRLKWLFNAAHAHAKYRYNGQAFVRYEIEQVQKKLHFTTKEIENNKDEGVLRLNFESKNGHDLNIKVKVLVLEKDLPATKHRIQFLQAEIERMEQIVRDTEQCLLGLNTANSQDQLEREITRENKELEEQIHQVVGLFVKPINESRKTPEKEWDAVEGLERLLILLKETGTIHPDLSPANQNSIQDFLTHCQTVGEAFKNPYLKKFLPHVIESQQATDSVNKEMVPPVWNETNLNGEFYSFQTKMLQEVGKAGINFIKNYQLECGVSAIITSVPMAYGYSYGSLFMMFIGIFSVVNYAKTKVSALIANAAETKNDFEHRWKEVMNEIEIESKKAIITAEHLSIFATQRFSEKLNIDIKADLKKLAEINGIKL